MTSASELFYSRRSDVRSSRISSSSSSSHEFTIFDSDSSSSPSPEHRVHRRRRLLHHRHEFSDRSPHVRLPHELGSIRFERSAGHSSSVSTEMVNIDSSPGSHRLPGDVLLARERLLERLRGVSISENGQSNRSFSGNSRGDDVSRNDFRLVDAGNWGPETSVILPTGGYRSLDMTLQTYRSRLPRKSKKPPGLTQEDIASLDVKVFSKKEDHIKGEASEASCDCSICLESFLVGDELIYLPCGHKFHSACLNPWIRTCGDCPYCRRDIAVGCQRNLKSI